MIARLGGTLAALVLVAAGGAAMVVTESDGTVQQRSLAVTIPAPDGTAACPGGQFVPVGAVGGGGELASEPTIRSFASFPDRAYDLGGGRALVSNVGVQAEFIGDGDIAGWSALTCGTASADQWLVGGSTSLGSSARLVLSNPSSAATETTVTVYGPLGEVEDRLVIAVGPRSQTDRLIEADAPQLSALVLRVEASGPGVVAALQDSRLDGFQPAGTEWVGASAAAQKLVIPAAHAGVEGAQAIVRLMAPEGATVELTLIGAQGVEPWSIGRALDLEPGVVSEVRLPAQGLAAVEVSADAPVVAAARTVVESAATEGVPGDIKRDDAWVQGVVATEGARTAVTPVDNAVVAVYSATAMTVDFTDANGTVIASREVPARTVQRLVLPVPAGSQVSSDAQAVWAIILNSGEGQLAAVNPIVPFVGDLATTVIRDDYPSAP